MGVSGCGKTSLGEALAESCGLTFIDGDDLHPKANVEKMRRGEPLTDEDRAPWLVLVGQALARAHGPAAIGCSALKRNYRDVIRAEAGAPVAFVHLHAPKDVLARRVEARKGHFMPAGLLESQFEALELMGDDELGHVVDIDQPLDSVVAEARAYVLQVAS
ncbi:MAG: gluconokinase [Pseudomonadota bacterium]